MHADKLYHQMLDFERKVKEAKEAGLEPPPIMSLFQPERPPQAPATDKQGQPTLEIPGGEAIPAGFKPSKPLRQLSPHEREVEIRAHNAQIEQQKLYVDEASPFIKTQGDAREKRRERAVGWFGETIGNWVS